LEVGGELAVARGAAVAGAGVAADVFQGAEVVRGEGLDEGRLRDLEAAADDARGAGGAGVGEAGGFHE
jgi:hypothetical protein